MIVSKLPVQWSEQIMYILLLQLSDLDQYKHITQKWKHWVDNNNIINIEAKLWFASTIFLTIRTSNIYPVSTTSIIITTTKITTFINLLLPLRCLQIVSTRLTIKLVNIFCLSHPMVRSRKHRNLHQNFTNHIHSKEFY